METPEFRVYQELEKIYANDISATSNFKSKLKEKLKTK